MDEYGVDPPLNYYYPLKCQQIYAITNVCIYNHNAEGNGYIDKYGVDPPFNHHYLFKGQEAYTIIKCLCIYEYNSEGDEYGVDPLSTITTFLTVNKPIPA